jgi:hypothetical protein
VNARLQIGGVLMRYGATLSIVIFLLPAIAACGSHEKPAAAAAASDSTADSTRTAAVRDGWPDTRAGETASGWVTAFSTGEAAMKEFDLAWLTAESLEKKSVDERIKSYRKLHERFGTLALASVVKSTPGELTVSLLDSDVAAHEFIFTVQTKPPYKLVSVAFREKVAGHGHFGFHH